MKKHVNLFLKKMSYINCPCLFCSIPSQLGLALRLVVGDLSHAIECKLQNSIESGKIEKLELKSRLMNFRNRN